MTQQFSHAWAKRLGNDLRIEEFGDDHPRRQDYITFMIEADAERIKLEDVVRAVVPPQAIVTGRTKSIDTLREKLIRLPHQALDKIDDVVGVRIVHQMTLDEQDQIVESLKQTFGPDTGVKDRRETPSAGYRAVHLTVRLPSLRGEVQVRTMLQARWADLFERLADTWGRGMRYGSAPNPDASGDSGRRLKFVENLVELSLNYIAGYESQATDLTKYRGQVASLREPLKGILSIEIREELEETVSQAGASLNELEGSLKEWGQTLDSMLGTMARHAEQIP
jgi:hypothetical protein